MCILTVSSTLRQIPIQIPIIWLPVGCCDQFSRGIQMVTHIVGFVGRRIFPPYVFLVYTNGTLGDRNFSALLLKRLNRNDIGLRLTPKHPAARGRKWKIWYPEWEPKSINRPQINVFGSRGVARIFQRKWGGGGHRGYSPACHADLNVHTN